MPWAARPTRLPWTVQLRRGLGQHHVACQPHFGRYPGAERQHDLVDVARDHPGHRRGYHSFTVSGSGLSANASVSVVAPSGCEISLSGSSGFANMLPLTASSGGTLSSTQIYSRISASAATNISGVISFNDSVDSCSKLLPVSGTVTPVSGPVNNNFVNRTPISGTSATVTGSNVGATKESGEPNPVGNSGGKSVWWTWTAPSSGTVQIDTIGSSFDTIMGVYTGNGVSSLTLVACDDDSGGNLTSKVTFNALGGTAYQIVVDGYNYGSGAVSGNITLHVSLLVQPDFTLPAYRQNNPLWLAGYAPASTNPPNPQLGNALGNCTWYANGRLRELGYSSADLNRLIGDASTWVDTARANGIPVGTVPTVGAIAQTVLDGHSMGHVAVVERLNGDGTIVISESSYYFDATNHTGDFLWRHPDGCRQFVPELHLRAETVSSTRISLISASA